MISLSLRLALRSLRFRRLQTGLAILGVGLGVLALTLILGIQNGFRQAFVRQILESAGHVTLSRHGAGIPLWRDKVELLMQEVPGVEAVAPAILGQGLLENGPAFAGVNLKAFDPVEEAKVTKLLDAVLPGGGTSFHGPNQIMLGVRLARDMGLRVGDTVKLVVPGGGSTTMWVRAILDTGVSTIDRQTVFTSLRFAGKAFGYGPRISHLFLNCRDPEQADVVARRAAEATGLIAESWKDQHQTLLSAMELERRAMFVIIALTLMVAGFGVSNVLTLMVYDKYQDVGILRSLGASARTIRSMFLWQGWLIGCIGTLLGIGLCFLVGGLLEAYPIPLPGGIYYTQTLPIRFVMRDFFVIGCLSLFLSTLAGLPSALRAIDVDPVAVLRGN